MSLLSDVTSLEAGEGSPTDMAVSAKTVETRREILKLERRIGFRRMCVNVEVDSIWTPNAGKKKKKREEDRDSPQPASSSSSSSVPHPNKSTAAVEEEGCRLYSRLTFPLTDPIQLNKMATPSILSYDVIAVEPNSEKLFHKVCVESENVDLVTFDYLKAGNYATPPFKIPPGVVKVGQDRGIHFEIVVGPGLRSANNAKQNLISYARRIVTATKGKNVILSLGAVKCSEVRGPHDLINLGVLFGMNQSQAKDAVTKNFDAILRHSLTRKSGGGVVTFAKRIHCGQKTKDQMARLRKLKRTITAETSKRDETKSTTTTTTTTKKNNERSESANGDVNDGVVDVVVIPASSSSDSTVDSESHHHPRPHPSECRATTEKRKASSEFERIDEKNCDDIVKKPRLSTSSPTMSEKT